MTMSGGGLNETTPRAGSGGGMARISGLGRQGRPLLGGRRLCHRLMGQLSKVWGMVVARALGLQ